MARNNIKLLTDAQLAHFNKRYHFSIVEDKVVVRIDDYERVTRHSIDKPFAINAKKIRKICFSVEAIEIWKQLLDDGLDWTLVDVQQAINRLYIMYQFINIDSVKNMLVYTNEKTKN